MVFLDPKNNVAFKRVFDSEEHKNITISFLNSLIENTGQDEITSIEFLNNEQLPQRRGAQRHRPGLLFLPLINQISPLYGEGEINQEKKLQKSE